MLASQGSHCAVRHKELTYLEAELFRQTNGKYTPLRMGQMRRLPAALQASSNSQVARRISVLTPTTASRGVFHEQLWTCFDAQTWSDKELIIVETYQDEPSQVLQALAAKDTRMVLASFQHAHGNDLSIGVKRNMCVHLASGDVCVNFDDDDIYADTYCEQMVLEMHRQGWEAMTLSAWHNFFVRSGTCGFSDLETLNFDDMQEREENVYGYGFSYVFKRTLATRYPYPDLEFGEDAPFMLQIRRAIGNNRVGLLKDNKGLCLHVVHRDSTCIDPDVSRVLTADEVACLKVSGSAAFEMRINASRCDAEWCLFWSCGC